MRRTALLLITLSLPGCTGFGQFLDHTFSFPPYNPNLPMTDSENLRRARGGTPEIDPLQPEPGNVWPGPQAPEPTLEDLQRQQNTDDQGAAPSQGGGRPFLPDHTQPRPRGSSTPPGSVQPGPAVTPNVGPTPTPPSSIRGAGPQGQIVQTPRGPAVDAGGTNSYRQLTTPQGPGAIMVPNGNGTSTIINPNGSVQTVPTPGR